MERLDSTFRTFPVLKNRNSEGPPQNGTHVTVSLFHCPISLHSSPLPNFVTEIDCCLSRFGYPCKTHERTLTEAWPHPHIFFPFGKFWELCTRALFQPAVVQVSTTAPAAAPPAVVQVSTNPPVVQVSTTAPAAAAGKLSLTETLYRKLLQLL